MFYCFSSVNECKYLYDQPMLILFPAFHVCQQCCQIIGAFTLWKPQIWNKKHALGIPIIRAPHAFGFPDHKLTIALRFPKSHSWYRYEDFLNSPIWSFYDLFNNNNEPTNHLFELELELPCQLFLLLLFFLFCPK